MQSLTVYELVNKLTQQGLQVTKVKHGWILQGCNNFNLTVNTERDLRQFAKGYLGVMR